MTLARLYGRQLGHGSLSVVTRGFEQALRHYGALRGFYPVDLAASYADGECPTEGADAKHGVYVGPLNAVGQMFEQGRHEVHWVMVTPNSDRLPQDLVTKLLGYQKTHNAVFMAPSRWASKIVSGYLGQCLTVPHGVSMEYHPRPEILADTRALYEGGEFRVIHFSSSDRQRKGTVELLQAWEILLGAGWAWSGARLLCVMDYPAKAALEEAIADGEVADWKSLAETVTLMDRADLPPENMVRNLSRSHVACQPSRGEGFGFIPLEALSSGVPVVATTVTGHSEYLWAETPGLVPVSTGELRPIDDLPGSLAPGIAPLSIAHALVRARNNWIELSTAAIANAHMWQSNWSWEASLEPFIERLRNA